jgi:hypothetical protein
LAVLGAATAEPARRRVLATARNFILNEKREGVGENRWDEEEGGSV